MFRRLPQCRTIIAGILIIDLFIISLVYLFLPRHNTPPQHVAEHPYFFYDLSQETRDSQQKCVLPRVHPFDPSIWDFLSPPKSIVCKSRGWDLTYIGSDGNLKFNASELKRSGYVIDNSLHCYWSAVDKDVEDDDKVFYGKEYPLHRDEPVNLSRVEIVQVRCLNFAGLAVYEQLHAHIRNATTPTPQQSPLKNAINVFIFGLDSLSRMAFIRLLPQTYRYLTEVLNMTVFRGMNKVGDNTSPNLIALLTGRKQYGDDLPEPSGYFDDWPLIWKNYSKAGFSTMWAEDFPEFGLFNYLAKGFRKPPTDHYLRPFWLALEESKLFKFSSHMCYGSVPKHLLQIDYSQRFISKLHNASKPYFGFSFLAELSHEYLSRVSSSDEQFKGFFTFLQDGGFLRNTVLLMLSDHGHRFDAIRSTKVGHIEERLPFVAMYIPKSLSSVQPHILQALSLNSGRLVTPFDTHATLMDLLHFAISNRTLGQSDSEPLTRGLSMFKPIPLDRSCADASIPTHFCVCEKETPISVSDSRAQSAAEATIEYINTLLQSEDSIIADECSILKLKVIMSAHLVQSEEDVKSNIKVRVVVEAEPSGGVFEATTLNENGRVHVLADVSRINQYGHQSDCIKHIILRKYCYCKNLLPSSRVDTNLDGL